jgi:hypothetical protein
VPISSEILEKTSKAYSYDFLKAPTKDSAIVIDERKKLDLPKLLK